MFKSKILVATLALVITFTGMAFYLTGCEKSEPNASVKPCPEDCTKSCCAKKSICPADRTKPCCATTKLEAATVTVEQTTCPILGGEVNKEFYAEYKGQKVYFCCAGCIEKFKAEPEKYLEKLPQFK